MRSAWTRTRMLCRRRRDASCHRRRLEDHVLMTSYVDGDVGLAPRGSLCNNSLLSHTTGVTHIGGGQSHTSVRGGGTTGSVRGVTASRKASCCGATTALIEYN